MRGKINIIQNNYYPPDPSRESVLTGLPLASFPRRALALLLDFLIAGILFVGITVGGGILIQKTGIISSDEHINLQFTFFKNWYSIVWLVVYFTLSVYLMNGQTIGKKICRIRIVSLVHEHMSLWHSFERSLGYGASALELGFGFFQYFLRTDRRTVHDRIAETIVIDDRSIQTSSKNDRN
jgi:uncharacterized RDD family membrane protein YckC